MSPSSIIKIFHSYKNLFWRVYNCSIIDSWLFWLHVINLRLNKLSCLRFQLFTINHKMIWSDQSATDELSWVRAPTSYNIWTNAIRIFVDLLLSYDDQKPFWHRHMALTINSLLGQAPLGGKNILKGIARSHPKPVSDYIVFLVWTSLMNVCYLKLVINCGWAILGTLGWFIHSLNALKLSLIFWMN